jgi:hypothetical protein
VGDLVAGATHETTLVAGHGPHDKVARGTRLGELLVGQLDGLEQRAEDLEVEVARLKSDIEGIDAKLALDVTLESRDLHFKVFRPLL